MAVSPKARQKKDKPKSPELNLGDLNPKQIEFCKSRTLYTAFGGARGGGKALEENELVCTPTGYKRIGDIEPGDFVIGANGKPTKVIGVYPQGLKECYKINFFDGASCIASKDHIWTVRPDGNNKYRELTTHQIAQTIDEIAWRVPICAPVLFENDYECPIRPYTLGYFIGAAKMPWMKASVHSKSVLFELERNNIKVLNNSLCFIQETKEWNWLKDNGLIVPEEERFIPENLKCVKKKYRCAMFAGLMDACGYITNGKAFFRCSSEKLAEDFIWLARSLGGLAYSVHSHGKNCYEVAILRNSLKDFLYGELQSEMSKCPRGAKVNSRKISNIRPVGLRQCVCIKVDAADELFVIHDFIVTHNTHVMRIKAVGGAITWPGIRILIIRRTYPELQQNHIEPIIKMVPPEVGAYNGALRTMYFQNGSIIKFGHANSLLAIETEYQGQEYDWIFMDEATQFSEQEFRTLGGCLRGVNEIPKRFYLSCNPGGIGHNWVKRLFIDRDFKTDCANPEENENPEDYSFIQAFVEDNTALMKSEGGKAYLNMLSALPEKLRQAHRYGDWNAISGAYFNEFRENYHTCKPFKIPDHWIKYRAIDYGLDMFVCLWFAVDHTGRTYVYREFNQSNLIVRDAAVAIHEHTLPSEQIDATFTPPDLWSRHSDTGKCTAEIFMDNGIGLVKASNSRVQGHLQIKEMLADYGDGKPQLIIFDTCKKLINSLQTIQTDDKNFDDCAKQPHELTHCVTGDTPILTPQGSIPIKNLNSYGDCYSWDGNKIILAKHTPAHITKHNADVFELKLSNGEIIKATAEHPVLTVAGWKMIDELNPGDVIVSAF